MVYPTHPNTQLSGTPRAAARASRGTSPALTALAAAVGVCIDMAAPVVLWLCDRFPRLAERWGDVDFEECE